MLSGPVGDAHGASGPGHHTRTCPVTVDAPVIVPLTPKGERAAIAALTELLADLFDETARPAPELTPRPAPLPDGSRPNVALQRQWWTVLDGGECDQNRNQRFVSFRCPQPLVLTRPPGRCATLTGRPYETGALIGAVPVRCPHPEVTASPNSPGAAVPTASKSATNRSGRQAPNQITVDEPQGGPPLGQMAKAELLPCGNLGTLQPWFISRVPGWRARPPAPPGRGTSAAMRGRPGNSHGYAPVPGR